MTREEAVERLKSIKSLVDKYDDVLALREAIKALEQEPCEDAISREDALMCMTGEYPADAKYSPEDIISKHIRRIKALPSVTPKQSGWIPVSERLPEIHQDVLLSLRSLDVEVGFRAETEPYFYCHSADVCYIEPQNVLAWMPLPEPYKAESEEQGNADSD